MEENNIGLTIKIKPSYPEAVEKGIRIGKAKLPFGWRETTSGHLVKRGKYDQVVNHEGPKKSVEKAKQILRKNFKNVGFEIFKS